MPTPTVITKIQEEVFIPPEYRSRQVTYCYTPTPSPPPGGGGSGGGGSGGGGENCQIVITRTLTVEPNTGFAYAPGEFTLSMVEQGDNLVFTLAKVECN